MLMTEKERDSWELIEKIKNVIMHGRHLKLSNEEATLLWNELLDDERYSELQNLYERDKYPRRQHIPGFVLKPKLVDY